MHDKVYVWDKFVRLFHWSLVSFFVISYVTAEEFETLHAYSGYAIAVLTAARVVWGFFGTKYARFTDFVPSLSRVKVYVMELRSGKADRYFGHNPLGGLMVVAFILMLSLITFSGMKLYALEEGKGPLANAPQIHLISPVYADSDEEHDHDHDGLGDGGIWEEVHELSVNLMIMLIVLHIVGVLFSSIVHKESLISAMKTGYKDRQ
ncbi:cytochrome b/b6 domain-containing protein [Amphritea balenae]|uniref:Cytochrome B n=1 Tax=Amphritea balenae TaxID=452629 RepID=A0A3P1STI8_9GAMM|nr:cytochrome b/b6 domain-containing protein [Amphritea balenae]RRD00524.1 cytochrome B [Amphritea balenae]GGK70010.1 cytochrome b561 [Amphritea balenae]